MYIPVGVPREAHRPPVQGKGGEVPCLSRDRGVGGPPLSFLSGGMQGTLPPLVLWRGGGEGRIPPLFRKSGGWGVPVMLGGAPNLMLQPN